MDSFIMGMGIAARLLGNRLLMRRSVGGTHSGDGGSVSEPKRAHLRFAWGVEEGIGPQSNRKFQANWHENYPSFRIALLTL